MAQIFNLHMVRGDTFLPTPRSALHASNRWHIHNRWRARKPFWRSVVEVWNNPPASLKRVIDDPGASKETVIRAVRSHAYVASQFNPGAAAALYNTSALSLDLPSLRVLDPCAGWGDRLAGALACWGVSEYLGFDANSALQAGYLEQIERYGDGGTYSVKHQAFEDAELPESYFDLVFTSPPYFRAEIYSSDPEQSSYRYATLAQWLEGFLEPLIRKSALALRRGGILCLNIAQVSSREGVWDLPSAAENLASGLGLSLSARLMLPLSNKKNEPVIIWEK
jgi:hypothetical protein